MPSIEGRVRTADGLELLTRHWPADEVEAGGAWAGSPWGVVLLVHGIGEHSGRYEHVGDQLAAAGLDVYAYDHRGQGGSEGRAGHVDRWSRFHDDLAERLAAARSAAAGRPVAVYAHSMGGLIAAGYLLSPRPKPDAAVLSAPALDSTLAGWKKALATTLGRLAPTASVTTDIDPATISRDPSVGARTATDPLCIKVTTLGLGAEGLREQARVRGRAREGFGVPTLVLQGLDDGLVPAASTEVLDGAPGVERRTYPGLRHELHNEPEGPQVVEDVITWLRTVLVGAEGSDRPVVR